MILTAGLPWGVMMFLAMGILNRSFSVASAVTWLIGGVVFGVAMWAFSEYRAKRSAQKTGG